MYGLSQTKNPETKVLSISRLRSTHSERDMSGQSISSEVILIRLIVGMDALKCSALLRAWRSWSWCTGDTLFSKESTVIRKAGPQLQVARHGIPQALKLNMLAMGRTSAPKKIQKTSDAIAIHTQTHPNSKQKAPALLRVQTLQKRQTCGHTGPWKDTFGRSMLWLCRFLHKTKHVQLVQHLPGQSACLRLPIRSLLFIWRLICCLFSFGAAQVIRGLLCFQRCMHSGSIESYRIPSLASSKQS